MENEIKNRNYMINFEKIEIKNGFVKIFDEDGLITIQMLKNDAQNIINTFNNSVQNKQNIEYDFNVENSILNLKLKFYGNNFCIEGRITEQNSDSSYFHDFNFENVDINS